MPKTFCFVILHYQNIEITQMCITSILNLNSSVGFQIVIVDNASPNNSGVNIKNEYKKFNNIHVIFNQENLGFSKGNNIGYKYAKNKLNSDTIIVMNNDIVIQQRDFLDKLESIVLENNNIDIIAPDIFTRTEVHQNPMKLTELPLKQLRKNLVYTSTLRYIYRIPIIKRVVYSFEKNRKKKWQDVNLKSNTTWKKEHHNIVPHGSCVIFCNNWIKNEDIAFLPITFMYAEEDILYDYCKKKKYKIVYKPEMQVRHYEHSSVEKVSDNAIKRELFYCDNSYKAIKVLINKRNDKN